MSVLNNFPADWREKIESRIDKQDLNELQKQLDLETNICPTRENIFRAFQLCSFQSTKVVIVGQEPYPNGKATGLAFAVKKGHGLSRSLQNIFKLLQQEGFQSPRSSELEGWAQQGVLLVNAVLTVRPGKVRSTAFSHADWGWQKITGAAIDALKERTEPVLFLAWGEPAKEVVGVVLKPHEVWGACHPSKVGAWETVFGACDHFKKVNSWLRAGNYGEIDWGAE